MSKRTEVEVFARTIAIPGVRMTRTGMVFERVDEESLRASGAFLQAVDGCAAWWWGDYPREYCGYEIKDEERESGQQLDELSRADRLKTYTEQYAAIAGKEPKTLWHYLSAARFYDSSRRREELTWSHHIEAKEAANGDEAVADNLLDLAVEHKWSHSELRAAIRKTKRTAIDDQDGPAAQSLLPMEIIACRRYASAKLPSVADMDIKDLDAQIAEMQPILAYMTAMVERRRQLATPVGKEFLTRAA